MSKILTRLRNAFDQSDEAAYKRIVKWQTLKNLFLRIADKLCIFAFVVALVYLAILPHPDHVRHTYLSENALVPGQAYGILGEAHTSMLNQHHESLKSDIWKNRVLEYFVQETDRINVVNSMLDFELESQGKSKKTAREPWKAAHAILQTRRGDGTESIIVNIPIDFQNQGSNIAAIAFALTFLEVHKKSTFWAKDIVIVIHPHDRHGLEQWLNWYYDSGADTSFDRGGCLARTGMIQAAISLELGSELQCSALEILLEGINGSVPNMDLINTVVRVAERRKVPLELDPKKKATINQYEKNAEAMARSVTRQALALTSGSHAAYLKYGIPAFTLLTINTGPNRVDMIQVSEVIEGTLRSLNNLLERLHHSFFLYIMMDLHTFIPVDQYLPPVIILVAILLISAIKLWILSTDPSEDKSVDPLSTKELATDSEVDEKDTFYYTGYAYSIRTGNKNVLNIFITAFGIGVALYFVSMNFEYGWAMNQAIYVIMPIGALLSKATQNKILPQGLRPAWKASEYKMIKSCLLCVVSVALAACAMMNISLGIIWGFTSAPIFCLLRPSKSYLWTCVQLLLLGIPTWNISPSWIKSMCLDDNDSNAWLDHRIFPRLQDDWIANGTWVIPALNLIVVPMSLIGAYIISMHPGE